MASSRVQLEQPVTKEIREAPVGFSWTTLFFGFIPALVRSDWKWGIIQALAAGFSGGLAWLVFPFIYNRLYLKEMMKKGFKPKETGGADLSAQVALAQAQRE